MNLYKILANAGISFFTTLSATALTGHAELIAALISAAILGGLAFFTEMKLECDEGIPSKVQSVVNKSLII